MINKFKDFLRSKLSRSKTIDISDQDEFLVDDDINQDQDATLTNILKSSQDETASHEEKPFQTMPDATSEIPPDSTSEIHSPVIRHDTSTEIHSPAPEEQSFEDDEGYSHDETSPSGMKERLTSAMAGLREKLGGLKSKQADSTKGFSLPLKIKTKNSDGTPLISPSLTKGVETFLSRKSREPIHQVFLVILIFGIVSTLGKITALIMRGDPVLNSPKNYAVSFSLDKDFNPQTLAQVKSINPFKTNAVGGKKTKVADTKCESAQQASNLPIKLVNTVVLQDSIKSMASVQIRGDRDLQELREGDQISNLAKIFKIDRLEILVKNLESGICESIASDKGQDVRSPISVMTPAASKQFLRNKKMNGIDNIGNKFIISKALIEEKLKNIAEILTQARAVKIQNPDGTLAFKLTELDPQGIFPYLGLTDDDIITSINGKPIYDINEVMGLFGRIKNLENLQLGVKREGSDSVQEYSIKK